MTRSPSISAATDWVCNRPRITSGRRFRVLSVGIFRRSSLGGRPVVREKVVQPGNRMIGDAGENVFEPEERINSHPLTGGYEASKHRCSPAAFIAT